MSYLKWLQDTRLMAPEGEGDASAGSVTAAAPLAPPAAAPPATPEFTTEQKAYMDTLVNTAVTRAVSETNTQRDVQEKGLLKNKDEILTQKKILQKQLEDNKLAQQMVDGDVEGARSEIKASLEADYTAKVAELQTKLDNNVLAGDNDYTDRVLDTYLNDLRVKSTYQTDLKASLKHRSTIVRAEDGTKSLLIDGKPATEHFTSWSNSEVAKDYVVAPSSSGGGGQGSGGTGGGDANFEKLNSLTGIAQLDYAYEMKKNQK